MKALRKAHVIAMGVAFILLSIIALASYLTSPAPVSGQSLSVTLAIASIDQCTGEVCFTAEAKDGTAPYTYDWNWDDNGNLRVPRRRGQPLLYLTIQVGPTRPG